MTSSITLLQEQEAPKAPALADAELERTEELPVLDVAAYEAERGAGVEDTTDQPEDDSALEAASAVESGPDLSSSTNKWVPPAIRAGLLDDAPTVLHAHLDKKLLASAPLTAEFGDIFEKIASLQARLSDSEESNSMLEERCALLGRECTALELRCTGAEASVQRLVDENSRALERLAEVNQLFSEKRAQFDAQLAEVTERLAASRSSQERLTELEGKLEAAVALVEQRERSIADLEARLVEMHAELMAAEAALAEQRSASEALGPQLEAERARADDLQQKLAAREADMKRLTSVLEESDEELDDLEAAAAKTAREMAELQAAVAAKDSELARLAAAAAEQEDLRGRLETAEGLLRLGEQDYEQTKAKLAEEQAALAQACEELATRDTRIADLAERLDTALASVQESKQGRDELSDQVSTLQAEIESLRVSAQGRDNETETLRSALVEERAALSRAQEQAQATAQQLQAEIAQRQRAESALAASLEERADLQRELRLREERINHQDTQVLELQTRWQDATQQMTAFEDRTRFTDDRVAALERELAQAQERIATLDKTLAQERDDARSLQAKVTEKDAHIGTLMDKLRIHEEALAAIRNNVNRIGGEPPRVEEEVQLVRRLVPMDSSSPAHELRGKLVTVGRTQENTIAVESNRVSRRHAQLRISGSTVVLEDLSSTNGTFVNGRQIKKKTLRDGDTVTFGNARFTFTTQAEIEVDGDRTAYLPPPALEPSDSV